MKITRKKSVSVVTGSRADYYLLKNLIFQLKKSKKIKLSILITGQHLSKEYGYTKKEIIKDFPKICKSIDIGVKSTDSISILNSVGIGINKIGKYFKSNKPNLIILLGDRYEMLSVGVAALFNNIKIAHIHGGELTKGALDDSFRHSISKFSSLHFPSHKKHKNTIKL